MTLPFALAEIPGTTWDEAVAEPKTGRVHMGVFTGWWKYLRNLLPYLYSELLQNGGVVDTVLFAMIGYNE